MGYSICAKIITANLSLASVFMGHWQTVQNQIRRRRTRRLIWFSTVCLNVHFKIWMELLITSQQPLHSKWNRSIDKGGKFHNA